MRRARKAVLRKVPAKLLEEKEVAVPLYMRQWQWDGKCGFAVDDVPRAVFPQHGRQAKNAKWTFDQMFTVNSVVMGFGNLPVVFLAQSKRGALVWEMWFRC